MSNNIRDMVDAGIAQLEELSIEITNKCAMRCLMCSSGSGPERLPNELSFDEHYRIMREARELGAEVVSFSGGDPVVVPDFIRYVEAAAEVGFRQILFYTTGVWASYSRKVLHGLYDVPEFTSLAAYGNKGLVIIFSLHSHVETVNDYIMGIPGAWDSIVRDLSLCRDSGIETWVHMVPMRPNIFHVSGMRDLCAELGVSKMSLLRFVPQTRGFGNREALLPSVAAFNGLQWIIEEEQGRDHPVALRAGCPIDFRHAHEDICVTEKPKLCHAGTDLMLVRPDGTVHPCAAWKSLPTDSNVKDKSLAEIWEHDEMFNAIRRFLRYGYRSLEGPCGVCGYMESCRGGCPAQRLHAYGKSLDDLYHPCTDPLCPTRMQEGVLCSCGSVCI